MMLKFAYNPKCFILFVIVIWLSACQSRTKNETVVFETAEQDKALIIRIDPTEQDLEKASEFIGEVKIIALETTPQSLIGAVKDIQFQKDRIFILDQTSSDIKIFSSDGTFLGKISNSNRGPEGYVELGGFSLCENDSLVEVYDSRNFSFITYDLNNNFIRRQGGKNIVDDFACLPDGKKVIYSGFMPSYQDPDFPTLSRLLFFNDQSEIYQKALPFEYREHANIQRVPGTSHNFTFNKDTLVFYGEKLNNDIFYIWEDEIKRKYTVDFGKKYTPTVNYKSTDYEIEAYLNAKTNKFAHIRTLLETERFLYLKYTFRGLYNFYLYDKVKGRDYNIPVAFIRQEDNLQLPMPNYLWGDYFVGLEYAFHINELISEYHKHDSDLPLPLREFVGKISEESNPLLFLMKWK